MKLNKMSMLLALECPRNLTKLLRSKGSEVEHETISSYITLQKEHEAPLSEIAQTRGDDFSLQCYRGVS